MDLIEVVSTPTTSQQAEAAPSVGHTPASPRHPHAQSGGEDDDDDMPPLTGEDEFDDDDDKEEADLQAQCDKLMAGSGDLEDRIRAAAVLCGGVDAEAEIVEEVTDLVGEDEIINCFPLGGQPLQGEVAQPQAGAPAAGQTVTTAALDDLTDYLIFSQDGALGQVPCFVTVTELPVSPLFNIDIFLILFFIPRLLH